MIVKWIRSNQKLPLFVSNPVAEIRKLTPVTCWNYCPTTENPADLLTRGLSTEELTNNRLWFNGPSWITNEQGRPQSSTTNHIADAHINTCPVTEDKQENEGIHNVINVQRYSGFYKLLRVTSYVQRFVHNARNTKDDRITGPLSEEINSAELRWIKCRQMSTYIDIHHELSTLQNKASKKTSPIIDTLKLFLDKNDVIRCKGRIDNSPASENAKSPILISKHDSICPLIINDAHKSLMHYGGINSTVAKIRQKFWIPEIRQRVKTILYKCVTCRKVSGRPNGLPDPPTLPTSRVTETPPFSYTGVEFCVPIYIKNTNQKHYICLFTCAVTRAVHLELLPSLSTESFILAFRRFTSRKSTPQKIISDNATTFYAANHELQEIFKNNQVFDIMANKRIKWQFITKHAPWHGGFSERLIALTKSCLKKVIGKSVLSHEEMRTVICEIEAILNDRPITHMSSDIDSAEPLTPAHLLYGRKLTSTPHPPAQDSEIDDPDFTLDTQSIKKRAQFIACLIQRFWKQWRTEYLTELRERHRATGDNREFIKCGTVVQIHEDVTPRSSWPLGLITELHHGHDNHIRSATVKTANSVTNRQISKLYPLEVYTETNFANKSDIERPADDAHATKTTDDVNNPRPQRTAARRARDWFQRVLD